MIINMDPQILVEEDGDVGSFAKTLSNDDDDWKSAVNLDLIWTGSFNPFLHLSGFALAK